MFIKLCSKDFLFLRLIFRKPLKRAAVLDLRGLVEDLVLIGSGVSGSVWRGRYQNLDVAVKKSHAPTFAAQMEQMDEIKLLAGLPPHPHVLGLLGAYLEDGAVCSVTPFMPGGSLEARMRDLTASWLDDPAQITAIMLGLFNGMGHLHAHGVLHRDGNFSLVFAWFFSIFYYNYMSALFIF